AIADLFPFFFILVTMLMTSNTMARMIVEERGEMGTLSSLGYSPRAIISTYLAYVLSATLTGSFIGYFVGTLTLPRIIYSVFPLKMPEMSYYCNNAMIIMIMAVTFVVMTIVTVYNCMKELKSVPAALLRPKAPAASSTILLERITWIWKKLSFSWKITMRNLARFKSRAFITILGTMGCSFIILLGFCVRDGINGIGAKQYREFFTYDAIAVLNQGVKNHTTKIEDLTEGYLNHSLLMYQNSCKGIHQDESINFYLIVPENQPDFFRQYFHLRDYKTKEALTLKDGEAIISQKIATKFHLSVGDTLTFEDSDSKSYQVKIGGIAENYVANYLYLTTQTYTRLSHDELKYNIIVGQNRTSQENITQHFLDNDDVVSIQFSRDLISKANGGINGLNHIVIMLVIIASLLAFSVLYNLTSINISERTREIATLKVLGFDDRETNNYVYRETIINILIGIFAALIATTLVWPYMATMFENDNNIFLKEIKPMSYVYTVVISLGFLFVMQGVTYLKIYVIDMIESLKSIE
ncbi:MAG: FtsX-like permease family protein, partial [bacterium]